FGNPNNQITITAGTPPTDITVNLVKSAPAIFPSAVQRTYTITPNGGSGITATLRLPYLHGELAGNNPQGSPHLPQDHGQDLDVYPPTTPVDTTGNWVENNAVQSFSTWTFSTCTPQVVTNTNDSGAGSVRQAIIDSCPGSTITFDPSLTTGGPATITLTSGELVINNSVTIQGPAANLLEISGNNGSRVFNLSGAINVSLSGLTIAHGKSSATDGGIFSSGGGTLTPTACEIRDNQGHGGNAGEHSSLGVERT